jgi:hypothetical protein
MSLMENGLMTFVWVLAVMVGLIIAFMIVFAPIKLWSIDKTLKDILAELKKNR